MNIIEKLNKMELKNLQNIDYTKLLTKVKGRPDLLITIGAIVAAVFISSKIYIHNSGKMDSTKKEIKALEEKITAINNYKQKEEELKQFVSHIPEPINGNNLMNLLTDLAVKRQIQIESFSPSADRNTPLSDMSGLILNLSSDDYKNLWLFIHDIEQSAYPIHIHRLKASSNQGSKLSMQLEIVAVNLEKHE